MDIRAVPTIRINIEHMKHGIISHMGAMDSELGEYMDAEIEKAIAAYDFESEVKTHVHAAITKAIEQYFTFGPGWITIKDSVFEAVTKSLSESDE